MNTEILQFSFISYSGDKVERVYEQEELAKQLWAIQCVWCDPDVGLTFQGAHKKLKSKNFPDCKIFKQKTLRSTVLKNPLKKIL